MAVVLGERPVLPVNAVDFISADGGDGTNPDDDYLDVGELFTGTPTITEAGTFLGWDLNGAAVYLASTDLTLANKVVNTASIVVKGNTVAAGHALQCKISGQQAGKTYGIRFLCGTDAGRTVSFDVLIKVK